jgi:hypothetical protein
MPPRPLLSPNRVRTDLPFASSSNASSHFEAAQTTQAAEAEISHLRKRGQIAGMQDVSIEQEKPANDGLDLSAAMENVPLWIRNGPWSPAAVLYIVGVLIYLAWSAPGAIDSYAASANISTSVSLNRLLWSPVGLNVFRVAAAVYASSVLIKLVLVWGVWPFASFTVTSWNLIIIKFATAAIADIGAFAPNFLQANGLHWLVRSAHMVSTALTGPLLMASALTVTVWWLVLMPVLTALLSGSRRDAFLRFNFSFVLLNLHLFNVVMAAVEFLASSRSLSQFDLWTGFYVRSACVLLMFRPFECMG